MSPKLVHLEDCIYLIMANCYPKENILSISWFSPKPTPICLLVSLCLQPYLTVALAIYPSSSSYSATRSLRFARVHSNSPKSVPMATNLELELWLLNPNRQSFAHQCTKACLFIMMSYFLASSFQRDLIAVVLTRLQTARSDFPRSLDGWVKGEASFIPT